MSAIPVREAKYREHADFEKPRLVGEYCVAPNGYVVLGRAGIPRLNEKLVKKKYCRLDLVKSRSHSRRYYPERKLDTVLKWIDVHAPNERNLKKACHDADFVCRRRLLSTIGQFPCDSTEGFEVAAVRYGGVIFLCEFKTDRKRRLETMSERDRKLANCGQNLELYVTLSTEGSKQSFSEKSDKGEDVKTSGCRAVFLANFGKSVGLRVLLSAEMDCVDSGGNFVQLKTQASSLHPGFWRNKSLKWWLQSHLVGVSDIVVGFRDDAGIVFRLDTVKVSSLAAEPIQKTWSRNIPINFIGTFLQTIKGALEEEPELTYYLCEFKRNASSVTMRPLRDLKHYQFIPDAFIDRFH